MLCGEFWFLNHGYSVFESCSYLSALEYVSDFPPVKGLKGLKDLKVNRGKNPPIF